MTNKEKKRLHQRYTKDTLKFGLFSFKPLLQLYSNTTPELEQSSSSVRADFGLLQFFSNASPVFRLFSLKRLHQTTTKSPPEMSTNVGSLSRGNSGQFMRQNATKSDQTLPKNRGSDHHYLILPGYLFMLCC